MNAWTIPVAEVEGQLSTLLAEVAKGSEVTLTEAGLPVARIVPAAAAVPRESTDAFLERVRALRDGVTLGGLKIKDLIEEGRM